MLGWNTIIRPTQIVGVFAVAIAAQNLCYEARAQQAVERVRPIGLADPNQPVETVAERYPGGQVKIRREMTLDAEENYILHGSWTMYSKSGDVIAEGVYRNNQRSGSWKRIYAATDSKLFSTSPYKNFQAPFTSQASFQDGQLHGKWVILDAKQRLISEWQYTDGLRHGTSRWYYPSGNILQEAAYNEGLLDGTMKHYDTAAKLIADDTYQLGQKLAEKVQHDNNGKLVSEGMFLHARRVVDKPDDWWNAEPVTYTVKGKDIHHGSWTTWYPSGHKKAEGIYDHDLRDGPFTWWYSNSQQQVSARYRDGKPHGNWTWWYSDGQKTAQGQYTEGVPTGDWTYWTEKGRLYGKAEYGKGEAIADRQQGANPILTSIPGEDTQ